MPKKITLKSELENSKSLKALLVSMRKKGLINGEYILQKANQLKDGQFTLFYERRPWSSHKIVRDSLKDLVLPLCPPPPKLKTSSDELLVKLTIFTDLHLGLLTWTEECGMNWDLKISISNVKRIINNIYNHYKGSTRKIRFLITTGDDFFHVENNDALTPKSKNKLEKDGRFIKVYRGGIDLYLYTIKLLSQIGLVDVVFILDNHAPVASSLLTEALFIIFKNNKNVTIDRSQKNIKYYRFNNVLISMLHGCAIKKNIMNAKIIKECPYNLSKFITKEVHQGHLHHLADETITTTDGQDDMVYRYLPTIIPNDDYNQSSGYSAIRQSLALEYDKKHWINTKVFR